MCCGDYYFSVESFISRYVANWRILLTTAWPNFFFIVVTGFIFQTIAKVLLWYALLRYICKGMLF